MCRGFSLARPPSDRHVQVPAYGPLYRQVGSRTLQGIDCRYRTVELTTAMVGNDHRPCAMVDRSDEGNALVQVWVQKVRFKHIGRVGGVELHYDRVTGRYSDPKADADAVRAYRAVRGE